MISGTMNEPEYIIWYKEISAAALSRDKSVRWWQDKLDQVPAGGHFDYRTALKRSGRAREVVADYLTNGLTQAALGRKMDSGSFVKKSGAKRERKWYVIPAPLIAASGAVKSWWHALPAAGKVASLTAATTVIVGAGAATPAIQYALSHDNHSITATVGKHGAYCTQSGQSGQSVSWLPRHGECITDGLDAVPGSFQLGSSAPDASGSFQAVPSQAVGAEKMVKVSFTVLPAHAWCVQYMTGQVPASAAVRELSGLGVTDANVATKAPTICAQDLRTS